MSKESEKNGLEKHYSISEICEMYGFTRPTVVKYIESGELRCVKIFDNYRIPASALEEAIKTIQKQ